jgi:hypothetical protein
MNDSFFHFPEKKPRIDGVREGVRKIAEQAKQETKN